jgi:hypothetical protein
MQANPNPGLPETAGCDSVKVTETTQPSQKPIDPAQFMVAPIGGAVARDLLIKHHDLGSYPAAIAACRLFLCIMPLQDHLTFVGVFSVRIQPEASKPNRAEGTRICELRRSILLDHVGRNGESLFLRRALSMLAKDKRRPDRRPLPWPVLIF